MLINVMQSALLLDVGRFFTGYGIGVFSYVVINPLNHFFFLSLSKRYNFNFTFFFFGKLYWYLWNNVYENSQVPVYIAEISPKNLRGALTTLNQLMIVIGSSVSFLVGSLISWKILALTGKSSKKKFPLEKWLNNIHMFSFFILKGLAPCIVLLFGLCFIPESPRWLVIFSTIFLMILST